MGDMQRRNTLCASVFTVLLSETHLLLLRSQGASLGHEQTEGGEPNPPTQAWATDS